MGKEFLNKIGFKLKDNSVGVYFKLYSDGTNIEIDLEKMNINYGGKIRIYGNNNIQNITKSEDWVVLECVNRLLEKGYSSSDILLEQVYPTGRGTSGRLDILVKKDKKAYLMIECKTWGIEFEKEFKKIQKDGGQLFTYFQQDRDTEFLILYASHLNGKNIEYINEIIKIEDSYRMTSNVEDLYNRWNKLTKQNGIFENWIGAYNFESKALTYSQLNDIKEEDASKIFNRFLEILRHNTVSDKPNAFNKMFTLFLCKIYDELEKDGTNDELEFQWLEGKDNDESFQIRLTDLYKKGMNEFLKKQITDFSDDEFLSEYGVFIEDENKKQKLLERIKKLRLQKNNEFAIKEVFDEDSFQENSKVLKEVVQLLEGYKLRYSKKHPFLGDFFELLLTTGLKQEAGQFFTPVPIARFICKSIPIAGIIHNKLNNGDNNFLPYSIDYAAGSGHFITEVMEEIQNVIINENIDKYNEKTKKQFNTWRLDPYLWAKDFVYGIEKDYRLVRTSKVGCYLHGDGIATIIHGDGLDSFKYSKDYRGVLKNVSSNLDSENENFDLLLSNPPYSISAFKGNLNVEQSKKDFQLYQYLTDNSSEIECLFIERAKQLLKINGYAGIILPSSILNNTGIYTKAREIILKNFEIISIVALGNGTFMATGTNTVVLFLKKRSKTDIEKIENSISQLFLNYKDVSLNNVENIYSKYCNFVWEVGFEDYISLLKGTPNETIKNTELYNEYKTKFNKLKESDLNKHIISIEREKILYFIVTYNKDIVLINSLEKQKEKEFLGYEFSFRRNNEGIHSIKGGKTIDEATMLYDMDSFENDKKASTYIYDGFNGNFTRNIDEELQEYILRTKLHDLVVFDRVDFDKVVLLTNKKKISIDTKWEVVKIANILSVLESGNRPKGGVGGISNGIFSIGGEHIGLDGKINTENKKYIPIDFFEQSNKGKLKKNDVLICKDGALTGKVAFLYDGDIEEGKGMINEHVFLLRTNNLCLQRYLFYFLYSKKGQAILKSRITGQAQGGLNRENLLNIKIPLPPIEIQQKIISEIEKIEEIEKNIKEKIIINKKNISFILEEAKKNAGFTNNLVLLSEIAYIIKGSNITKSNTIEGNVPVVAGGRMPAYFHNESNREGNIITISASGMNAGFVNYWDIPIFASDCNTIKSKDENIILTKLIYEFLLQIQEEIYTLQRGQAQPHVYASDLEKIKILLPPIEIQKKIVLEIEKIEKEIVLLTEKLNNIPKEKEQVIKSYLK